MTPPTCNRAHARRAVRASALISAIVISGACSLDLDYLRAGTLADDAGTDATTSTSDAAMSSQSDASRDAHMADAPDASNAQSDASTDAHMADADAGATDAGIGGGMTYGIAGQSCARDGGLDCPGPVSCCTQIKVPSGSYVQGTNTDPQASADESPPHTAVVGDFWIDKFEVTVGRFRSFVEAFDGTLPAQGAGAHPKHAGSGWQAQFTGYAPASKSDLIGAINCNTGSYQTWTGSAGVRETMPMNCVSWFVALQFCIWDGGRLPTEAEWEKAAANGGATKTRYPWGDAEPDASSTAAINCLGDGTSGCNPADLLPVGSRPLGADSWGIQDLAGSLGEWTTDYYDATYYQLIGTCTDCIDLAGLTPRVMRGGDFTSVPPLVRATKRASKPPTDASPYVGFRCARSL